MSDRSDATTKVAADADLMARLKVRDGQALADLYDRHAGHVYSLALKIVRVPGDAEEITQEVFLYAWEKAAFHDAARGSVAAWLGTMARSRAIDRIRRRKSDDRRKEAAGMLEALKPPRPGPELQASLRELGDQVRRALAALPADQRRAIEIAYFEGLSQSEIAARERLPLGTVKTRIRQGMQRLRTAVGPLLHLEAS